MKKLLLATLLALVATFLKAQTVSVDEARTKALRFLGHNAGETRSLPSEDDLTLSYISSKGWETYFYVFNRTDNNGFVIIGGDATAKDVLGYSDSGSFNYDSIPCNLRDLLANYKTEISYAIGQVRDGKLSVVKMRSAARTSKPTIAPLVSSSWDQFYPYNCAIPELDADNTLLTGCVATAGAQIMYRYRYPSRGTGSASYSRSYGDYGTRIFQANFSNTTYDWANMLDSYDGSETETQKRAVGTLMYHVGVGCNMHYGVYESSASEVKLGNALATYFGYDKAISVEQRAFYSDDAEWEDMVYSELAAGRPVIYCGNNSNSEGHAFVCDGYEDGRFHINWGWGGYFDGNFVLTGTDALWPEGQGAGGGDGSSGFIFDQTAVIGIQPNCGGKAKISVATFGQCALNFTSVMSGRKVNISNSSGLVVYNAGIFDADITYGVRLRSLSSSDYYDAEVATTNFACGTGLSLVSFVVPDDVPEGDYLVIPIFVNENGEWRESRGPSSLFPTLSVIAPTGIYLSSPIQISNDGYVLATDFKFSFSVKNPTPSEQTPTLRVYVQKYNSTYNKYSTIAYYTLSNALASGEEKTYVIDQNTARTMGKISQTGNYQIAVQDYHAQSYLCDYVQFEVTASKTITYKLTSVGWGTICLPFDADIPQGVKALSVVGVDDGELSMVQAEGKLLKDTPYLLNGVAGTFTFTGPITPEGTFTSGALTGTTYAEQQYAPKNSYILQNQSGNVGFYRVMSDNTQRCRQYSAYLNSSAGLASSFLFNMIGGAATSVEQPETPESLESIAYDLCGRPVGSDYKGLVIIGGRKVLRR